jgi:hypothetical protein
MLPTDLVECGTDLVKDVSYQVKNPLHEVLHTSVVHVTKHMTLVHLHKKHKVVASTIGKKDDLLFKSIPEDKGLDDLVEDEYARYI